LDVVENEGVKFLRVEWNELGEAPREEWEGGAESMY
jgi:hypothetical protein